MLNEMRDNKAQWRPKEGAKLSLDGLEVEVFSLAHLPTRQGSFDIIVFRNSADDKEHVAMVRGEVRGQFEVSVRLHSECLTGDVLGSLRCDCRDQLNQVLEHLGQSDRGVLLYMRQEGRGIGLGQKIRAYALQEQGLDTFEANVHLGFDADLRDYKVAALMLRLLGIESIELATNNPAKMFGLRAHGIKVASRRAVVTKLNPHNKAYVDAKVKAGHLLPIH